MLKEIWDTLWIIAAVTTLGFFCGVGFTAGAKLAFKNHGFKVFVITVEDENDQ